MNKALHVGVVREGRFIEDRWFKRGRSVTVGTREDNTFAFPLSTLGRSHALFAHAHGGLVLRFDEHARGKIKVSEGKDLDLAECRRLGFASPRGGHFELPISEESRGHVTLGEISFVFNFGTPPPRPPRPVLPRGMRGSIWNTTDHTFLSILLVSLTLHGCMIAAVSRRDVVPEDPTFAEIADTFPIIHIEPPAKPKEPPPVLPQRPRQETARRQDKTGEAPKDSVEHKREVQKQAQATGLNILIAKGGTGAIDHLFKPDSSVTEIAKALGESAVIALATTDPVKPKGADVGHKTEIGELKTAGPIGSAPRLRDNADIGPGSVKVTDHEIEVDSPSVNKDALAKFIQLHLASIQGCYEVQLKRSPNLRGKIVMQFTITATGAVSEASAIQDSMGSDPIAACIIRQIKAWKLPFKSGADVTVQFPFLFSPAN